MNPDHQRHLRDAAPDTLTIHEHEWAYCAYDVRTEGHVWEPTGGVPLSGLGRMERVS